MEAEKGHGGREAYVENAALLSEVIGKACSLVGFWDPAVSGAHDERASARACRRRRSLARGRAPTRQKHRNVSADGRTMKRGPGGYQLAVFAWCRARGSRTSRPW
jgi:hypothetical protein